MDAIMRYKKKGGREKKEGKSLTTLTVLCGERGQGGREGRVGVAVGRYGSGREQGEEE